MKRLFVRSILFALFCNFLPFQGASQAFTNGDLNGTVGVSATPTGWSQIPNTDPASAATGTAQATSDVTSATGPLVGAGIAAVPFSGSTCVTGLKMTAYGSTWHEGIQQTVTGLTPGNTYDITFYQAVVQQSNATDPVGAWDIYRNATYIGMTAPTSTALAYNNVNVVWNQRTITFQATATAHVLKFFPADDDNNINTPNAPRMGIDLITLSPAVVLPVLVELNAIRTNGGAGLSWEVRAEDQVQRSFLERSADGENFESFQEERMPEAGVHEYEDRDAHSVISYYRLGFVLMNGETVYSEIKSVSSPMDLLVYTFDNELMIQSAPGASTHEVELITLTGAQAWKGQVQERMKLDFLSPGVYVALVKVAGQEGSTVRKKIRVD